MNNPTNDEAAVRRLIEDWARSVREKDINGILRAHSPNILMFDVPPPLQHVGIDVYRKTWDQFFGWAHEQVVFDIKEIRVTADTNVAFASALMRCSGREANGEDIKLVFRLTVGLQKIDDQWIVTHEHHSIPATD
jgi:uncharacterized protein (TIGR02246 family)